MTIQFQCSSCKGQLRAKDEAVGKDVRCPKCENVQSVPAPIQPPPAGRVKSSQLAQVAAKTPAGSSPRSERSVHDNKSLPAPLSGVMDSLFAPRDAEATPSERQDESDGPFSGAATPFASQPSESSLPGPRLQPPQAVDPDLVKTEVDRDRKMKEAETLSAAGAFAKAMALLETVPNYVRTKPFRQMLLSLQQKQETVAALHKDIRDRVAAKQFTGEALHALRESIDRLLELQPNDEKILSLLKQVQQRQRRDEEKLWGSVHQQGTLDGFRRYLALHPEGAHAEVAKTLVSPRLRETLLESPRDESLRSEYLSTRTPELEQADEERARFASIGVGAAYGVLGGVLVGVGIGAVTGAGGGAVGGFIGGALLAAICDQA